MRSTTAGQHSFAKTPSVSLERSSFDRSCGLKTTFDSGYLVPVFCDEALPGDTMSLRMHNVTRLSTPLAPVMDNMYLDSFFFAVPIRLLWENWERFNGAQDDPTDSTSFIIPIIDTGPIPAVVQNSISDYIGIPIKTPDIEFSALWHRAYNLIWNAWFRDENLQDSVTINIDDGPDALSDYTLLKRGKRYDYFTSCLPWPQKGPAVNLPLGTTAPVVSSGTGIPTFDDGINPFFNIDMGGGGVNFQADGTASPAADLSWGVTSLEADLTGATASTINEIRQAFQIQKLYERDARGGTRYTEIVRSHFGVVSPDSRLQRPEFLGGGTQTINITPVPQTSETGTSPQGNLAAYGVSNGSGHSFAKSFTEHCIIIGMVMVRADLSYQQGLERQFSRSTRWDFFWPALAHIGEQAVLNKEIQAAGSFVPGQDDLVFGYQERFAEYRYKPSRVTGNMRSAATLSLDLWHLAQDFGLVTPTLDDTFIQEDPPIDRIVAVPSEPQFKMDAYFAFTHARPMPTFGVPGMVDRF